MSVELYCYYSLPLRDFLYKNDLKYKLIFNKLSDNFTLIDE